VMQAINGYILSHVSNLRHPGKVYSDMMNLLVRLACHGLIHCDFNEFNIIIDHEENITLIDFPQMVSTSHKNAEMYFDRDVQCIRTFFSKKYGFESQDYPKLRDYVKEVDLDVQVSASGFTSDLAHQFDALCKQIQGESESTSSNQQDDLENDSGSESEEEEEDEENDNHLYPINRFNTQGLKNDSCNNHQEEDIEAARKILSMIELDKKQRESSTEENPNHDADQDTSPRSEKKEKREQFQSIGQREVTDEEIKQKIKRKISKNKTGVHRRNAVKPIKGKKKNSDLNYSVKSSSKGGGW